jgi:uncharacterized protein (DUF4415 family)
MKQKTTSSKSGSDWERLAQMSDDEIDTSEIPPVPLEMFARGVVRRGLKPPVPKKQLTIRVDSDVLEWFKEQGRGYQTQINALLRAYMEAHRSSSHENAP